MFKIYLLIGVIIQLYLWITLDIDFKKTEGRHINAGDILYSTYQQMEWDDFSKDSYCRWMSGLGAIVMFTVDVLVWPLCIIVATLMWYLKAKHYEGEIHYPDINVSLYEDEES